MRSRSHPIIVMATIHIGDVRNVCGGRLKHYDATTRWLFMVVPSVAFRWAPLLSPRMLLPRKLMMFLLHGCVYAHSNIKNHC